MCQKLQSNPEPLLQTVRSGEDVCSSVQCTVFYIIYHTTALCPQIWSKHNKSTQHHHHQLQLITAYFFGGYSRYFPSSSAFSLLSAGITSASSSVRAADRCTHNCPE